MRQNQTITRDLVLKIVNVVPNSPSAESHFIPLQQSYLQCMQVFVDTDVLYSVPPWEEFSAFHCIFKKSQLFQDS